MPVLRGLPKKKRTWKELVREQVEKGKLKGATCAVYSTKPDETVGEKTRCICGRLAREHSFIGKPKEKFRAAQKWVDSLAASVNVTEYGQLDNGARVCSCLTQVLYDSFQLIFS